MGTPSTPSLWSPCPGVFDGTQHEIKRSQSKHAEADHRVTHTAHAHSSEAETRRAPVFQQLVRPFREVNSGGKTVVTSEWRWTDKLLPYRMTRFCQGFEPHPPRAHCDGTGKRKSFSQAGHTSSQQEMELVCDGQGSV
ncbi:hypothetical protein WMY93_023852 [Mugilogobius chulae]|uniref:Uncharacterized protein n=1 Tax=Mugilogobius chulae TaxID=88201 RepID=A0AAW0NCE2_9GOBI